MFRDQKARRRELNYEKQKEKINVVNYKFWKT